MTAIMTVLFIWLPAFCLGWLMIQPCIKVINSEANPEDKITAVIAVFLVSLIFFQIICSTINIPLHALPLIIYTIEILIGWFFIAMFIDLYRQPCGCDDKSYIAIVFIAITIAIDYFIIAITRGFFNLI